MAENLRNRLPAIYKQCLTMINWSSVIQVGCITLVQSTVPQKSICAAVLCVLGQLSHPSVKESTLTRIDLLLR